MIDISTTSQFVTSREAARILGVDRTTFERYEKKGLPYDLGELTPADLIDGNAKKPLYSRQYIHAVAAWLASVEQNGKRGPGRPRKGTAERAGV